ncbi:hypothetical protein V5799_023431 [Amblyomma americanum]|uniref:Uncharacterized protein n=1 Tax=Amblyomma americanum TaxID=6943 RepID=A0AAQ4FJC2_AMBAM
MQENELPHSTTQASRAECPPQRPNPQTVPRAHSKSLFCSLRALAVQLTVAALVAVLVLLLLATYNKQWEQKSTVGLAANLCCARESEQLYHHLNSSISPCSSLYHHVCGRYAERPVPLAFKDFNYYSLKNFYTPPNTTIGNAVYTLFQSCLVATADAHNQGSQTAAAYLDVLRPTIGELKTKHKILVFLLRMTVKFNIQPVPVMTLYGRGGWPRNVFIPDIEMLSKSGLLAIIMRKTRPLIEEAIAARYERMRRDCLKTINMRMNLNVSLEAMDNLETELDVHYVEKPIISNFSLVAQLVKSLTIHDWRRIVLNVSDGIVPENLCHSNVQLLSNTFSVLLNDTRQPDTIVFFIFKAVSDFLLEQLKRSLWTSTNKYFAFCLVVLNEYSLMGIGSAIEENMKSPEHDATLHNMFTEIVAAILRRAKSSFPIEDQPRLSSYLKSLRILLPTDIYPLNKRIPPLGRDYVQNLLNLFMSGWSGSTYQRPPGVTSRMSKTVRLGIITAFNDSVVIPIDAYSALHFGNGTERLVVLSVIGVQFADVVWKQIFYSGSKWSKATRQLLGAYKSCQRGLGVLMTRLRKHFSLPLLSIETAMELARDGHWLQSFQATLLWETSRCKLFYLLFVYHHYCPRKSAEKPALAHEVQYIASTSKDFHAAFKCPQPEVPIRTCFLNSSR